MEINDVISFLKENMNPYDLSSENFEILTMNPETFLESH